MTVTGGGPGSADPLHRLLGSWEVVMQHTAMPTPVIGVQRYDIVLGGAFVLMHATYDHPDVPDAIAVLSAGSNHYVDVRGVVRVFEVVLTGTGLSMTVLDDDFSQRIRLRFGDGDVMESTGQLSHDHGGTWQHDFVMTHRRRGRP